MIIMPIQTSTISLMYRYGPNTSSLNKNFYYYLHNDEFFCNKIILYVSLLLYIYNFSFHFTHPLIDRCRWRKMMQMVEDFLACDISVLSLYYKIHMKLQCIYHQNYIDEILPLWQSTVLVLVDYT